MTQETTDRLPLLLRALRSGEYEQGQGYLRYGGGHCCYGVACDVYARETKAGAWNDASGEDGSDEFVLIARHDRLPPDDVMAWYGLPTATMAPARIVVEVLDAHGGERYGVREGGAAYELADLNDRGVPFPAIADIIERAVAEGAVL